MGSESSYGGSGAIQPREVGMWIGVRHTHKKALEIFSREIAQAGTGMGMYIIILTTHYKYCKSHFLNSPLF